jgi:uncharacterized sulfatase
MDDRPNVLWLTLESVRADHTPMYGYGRNTTPHLQQFGQRADATVLQNGIAASNWTRPVTASILTGTHYSTHNTGGRGARGTRLPDDLETLPGRLADSGYHTALFSPASQISSDTGLDRGFEHYVQITMDSSNFLPTADHALDSWACAWEHVSTAPTLDPRKIKEDVSGDTNFLQLREIKRWARNRASSAQPFFAYAHIWSPHQAFQPIRRFRDAFTDEVSFDTRDAYDLAREEYRDLTTKIATGHTFTDEEWAALKAMYDAEILYADDTLHRIVETIESISDRDLVIVVTADHGELFGEKGVISHKITLHHGAISVPMVVVGIEDVADGPETMTQHIDLTYTVGALTETLTEQFEGRDIRDADRECAISQRREWEFSDYTDINPDFDHSRYLKEPHTAVCTSSHKYIESDSNRILSELPDEETNVVDDHPDLADELSAVIDAEGIEWDEAFEEAAAATFDEDARDRLRDLGYLA